MNNSENKEELIKKILTRQQLETESLIEAAKQNPKASKEEVVKIGKEIFQKKYSESVIKDEKEGIIAKMVNGIKKYMQIQEFYESNKNQLSEKRENTENNKRNKKAGFVEKIKTVINPIKSSDTVENEERKIEKDRDK